MLTTEPSMPILCSTIRPGGPDQAWSPQTRDALPPFPISSSTRMHRSVVSAQTMSTSLLSALPAMQTIVFTDIEGSTRLWVEHPDVAGAVIELHDEIMTSAFGEHEGRVVKSMGDGLLAIFPDPRSALVATAKAQQHLSERSTELGGAASVRMAVHCGRAEIRDNDVLGLEVNRCQRIMSAAHGGQILFSDAAVKLLGDPPPPFTLTDLGRYRLKSLDAPEKLHQLTGPGLRREFPPLESSTTSVPKLPTPISSFVGRADELEVVGKMLRGSRLVTLTGEGGVGKTRLALETASQIHGQFEDGIWLFELEGLEVDDSVALEVASTLDLLPTDSPEVAVVEHFEALTALVVFDNCERVVAGAAQLTTQLLARSPSLRVLTTSRERLAVPGEAVYRVPPMPIPEADEETEASRRYDAVRLFSERAEMATGGFRLLDEHVAAVIDICRRLDGLPLAIELAAAKSAALDPHQIAEGLSRRLQLLDRSDGDLSRHRSLSAAVAWSFDLLESTEQQLFMALSVFQGGFDSEAAAAVAGDDQSVVLPALASLADKSLIRRDPATSRFRMLEPLRVFAAEALTATHGSEGVRLEHAQWHAHLAAQAYKAQRGSDLGPWLDRLDRDHANLRAAYDWAMSADRVDLAMRIAVGSAPLWKHRGHAVEGRRRLEAALAVTSLDASLRARGLLAAGDLAADLGDTVGARRHLEASRRLGREGGDHHTEAWALARLASIAHKEADLPAATILFGDAVRSAREAGDDQVLSHVLASLALLVADQGDSRRAGEFADEALERSRTTANPYAVADALLTSAEIALNQGDTTSGRQLASEAIEFGTREGLGDVTAWSLAYLGWAALLDGDLRAGQALLEDATERFEEVGTPMGRPWAIRHLALGRWWSGDNDAAVAALHDGLRDAVVYVRPEAPMLLEVLAWVVCRDSPETAARLLGCAEAHRRKMGLSLAPIEAERHESVIRSLREVLGPDHADLLDEGRSLTIEAAMALGKSG